MYKTPITEILRRILQNLREWIFTLQWEHILTRHSDCTASLCCPWTARADSTPGRNLSQNHGIPGCKRSQELSDPTFLGKITVETRWSSTLCSWILKCPTLRDLPLPWRDYSNVWLFSLWKIYLVSNQNLSSSTWEILGLFPGQKNQLQKSFLNIIPVSVRCNYHWVHIFGALGNCSNVAELRFCCGNDIWTYFHALLFAYPLKFSCISMFWKAIKY